MKPHFPLRPPHRSLALVLPLLLSAGVCRAQLPAGTWQYAWGDDFSGTMVDATKWNVASPGWTMPNSLSTAAADKVRLGSGVLSLDATRTGTSGATQFSSGSISSYQKQNFTGGYIEARIWLPDTPGSWPAFWGLYDGWPPEMDIMEYPITTAAGGGYAQDEYHTAFHYQNTSGGNSAGAGKVNPGSAGDLGGGWHTFGVNWVYNTSVAFYFDGAQVSSFSNPTEVAEMANMYLILDYAVGGWPGTPNTTEWPVGFSDETKVDWVRVWRSAAAKTSNWVNTGSTELMLWDTAANWTNGAPNLGGVTSNFGTVTPAAQRIDWTGRRTLSVMNLDGATRYRFGWPDDRLVLGFGNGGALQPAINLAASTTSEQEIYGELEWAGTLAINNSSAQPLRLTGKVLGGDAIAINGPGAVSFEGDNNPYTGTVIIDSGSAGPGVARARGKKSLGVGTVVIGETGNATNGRLELENQALVANAVTLSGRNTATAGLVNLSGTNTISGTVSLQAGGGNYWIQSDAGQLVLSGQAGSGVAVKSLATGTRNVTLRGAGDGRVSGAIQNGNATVNVEKTDAGTWTLGAANSYTGTTTVSGGTLVVAGTTGSGATTVAGSATLGGRGTILAGLTAQAGATVRVGDAGFPRVPPTPFSLVDDFADYPAGGIGTAPGNATGDLWTGVFNGTANAVVVSNSGDKALQVNGINAASNSWRGAITDLRGASLPNGQTGTYFFRVKSANPATTDFIFGLTDQPVTTTAGTTGTGDWDSPWNEYAVTLSLAGGNLRGYSQGSGDVAITPVGANQWINVWIIVDNGAKTYRVATSTGNADGSLFPTILNFGRRTSTVVGTNPLTTFGAYERVNVAGQIDDLYFATTPDLKNPVAAAGAPLVPVPATLNVAGGFTLAAGATLELDVSTGALQDKLVVGGSFSAAGTLKVTLDPTQPAPQAGDSFDLFDAGTSAIAFATIDLPALSPGLGWDTSGIATGALSVVAVADASSYAGWALGQPFEPGTGAPSGDAESDGVANAFEWLLGGDPFAADTGKLPAGQLRSYPDTAFPGADPLKEYFSLTAVVRKNFTGMTLVPQAAASPALLDAPGSSADIISRQLEDLGEFERREWIHTIPADESPTLFMRLKLVGDPAG